MKLLIAFLAFGTDVFGGIEHALYNFILGLGSQGIDVVVFTGKAHANMEVCGGAKIYASKFLQKNFTGKDSDIFYHYMKNKVHIQTDFLRVYNQEKPDAIICVDHLWGILPILDIKVPCKKILWLHVRHNDQLLKQAANADYTLFAVSEFLRKDIQQLTNKYIDILPNSIIYNDFQVPHVSKRIIFCNARISPEKRVVDLVQAFCSISNVFKDFELHLCSGKFPFGDMKSSLREIKQILKTNPHLKVVFHDNFCWQEIPKFLATCAVVALPTKSETFGIAALEALAAGVPLVASRAGNLPYLIGQSGVLVSPGNIDEISNGVIEALTNGTNIWLGKKIAQRYDYIVVAKAFLEKIKI